MSDRYDISVVIPTCPGRTAKLKTLLSGIASTRGDHERFEVVVVVDGLDESPLQVGAVLPDSIHFRGLTQAHGGPGRARNHALEHAKGEWLLFFDDDARVDDETITGHLHQVRQDPRGSVAYLGRTYWPEELLDSPWQFLLANTSMVLFWDQVQAGRTYGFRHFCTNNLSVRADLVRAVGGFRDFRTNVTARGGEAASEVGDPDDSFRFMHEDIELGWRLEQRFALEVHPVLTINSWHDHAMTPKDYFRREYRCGKAAALVRTINPDFHDAVYPWLGDASRMAQVLDRLFTRPVREIRQLLERWSVPSDYRPGGDELRAMYLAHLPLKRMAFCQGYLGLPFEDLWDGLESERIREPAVCAG